MHDVYGEVTEVKEAFFSMDNWSNDLIYIIKAKKAVDEVEASCFTAWQYVDNLLIVGCGTGRNLNLSSWVVAYGIKGGF